MASATSFLARLPCTTLGCVLVDLQMPDMTGPEFQQRLRAAGWSQPLLFLSGQATIAATTQALEGCALDFLTKPVRSEDLLKAVGEAVERHRTIVSTATIKFHGARGLIKLGVKSVPELVLLLDKIDVLEMPIGPVSRR